MSSRLFSRILIVTKFTTNSVKQEEIVKLYDHFQSNCKSQKDDFTIDKSEFSTLLGLKDSLFVDRMFALFDTENKKRIDFKAFISGLSVFSEKGTMDEKLKCKKCKSQISFIQNL